MTSPSTSKASQVAIAILGGGSMGSAIARGLVASGLCPASHISVADHNPSKLEALRSEVGVTISPKAKDVLEASPDLCILAVKPQVLNNLIDEVGDALSGSLIVSIAAGVTLATLQEALGEGERIVRVMPNLPVAVRQGASAVAPGLWATENDVQLCLELFGALGSAAAMTEERLEVEGAVVGCAPAFFALLVDTLTRAAIDAGLPAAQARDLLNTTMGGVSSMLSQSQEHPRAYMERVTSPGGTTSAALRELELLMAEGSFKAVEAALARACKLSQNG